MLKKERMVPGTESNWQPKQLKSKMPYVVRVLRYIKNSFILVRRLFAPNRLNFAADCFEEVCKDQR